MFDFRNDGRKTMLLVAIAIVLFLFFHNFTEPFQSRPNRGIENTVIILIFIPLLFFTWKKKDWARIILGGITEFLFLTGIISLFYYNEIFNGLGGLYYLIIQICLFTASYHLFCSQPLKDFVRDV